MARAIQIIIDALKDALKEAVTKAQAAGELPEAPNVIPDLQVPRDPRHGDFYSNLALAHAFLLGRSSREIAQIIARYLLAPEGVVERVEIAGPGFINFTLSPVWLGGVVREIGEKGLEYGTSNVGQGQRLLLEFVSANPTGPVAVVQGRAAAIGDALANLFTRIGWQVSREYYINDALNSTQVRRFAETLEARYLQQFGREAVIPEDGYQGDYVITMAEELVAEVGEEHLKLSEEARHAAFYDYSLRKIIEGQQADMAAFGVSFDTWFHESWLYERGEVEAALEELTRRGHTYESEGAVWFRATAFGDDQDHVLVRQDGRPGYLASDIAYHKNKFERGFERLIDIWGPDHHGHVPRTRYGVQAIGYDASRFEILVHQFVRLFSGTEIVKMSKRAGDIIPLKNLIGEVGTDAARFFFLMQSMDSHLDFDLELAKKQAQDNPVYYVQYAHARICSILREAEARGVTLPEIGAVNLDRLEAPDEATLMRKLADLPEEIEQAAVRYEPHRMTRYARELAAVFHVFYTNCRVLTEEAELTAARLALVMATRTALRIVLSTIGVSAPEQM
jgi:arginyl-tRNA synthetase